MNKNLNLSEKNNFFALGPTFRSHQKEINRNPRWPDLWSIPNQCIITESDTIEIPSYVSNVKPGVELTAVIGGELWQSTTKEAWDSIAGFTISNDVTVTSEWPGWPESNKMKTNFGYKMFPTFKPISSQYQEKKEIEHYRNLDVWADVDGEESISGNTNDLHFEIPELISYVSHICRLTEGDVVALGDPGYADIFLDHSETVTCSIESIGELKNSIEIIESSEPPFKS